MTQSAGIIDRRQSRGGIPMAKRGRKKKARKHNKANHGNRPNS